MVEHEGRVGRSIHGRHESRPHGGEGVGDVDRQPAFTEQPQTADRRLRGKLLEIVVIVPELAYADQARARTARQLILQRSSVVQR